MMQTQTVQWMVDLAATLAVEEEQCAYFYTASG